MLSELFSIEGNGQINKLDCKWYFAPKNIEYCGRRGEYTEAVETDDSEKKMLKEVTQLLIKN